MTQPLPPALKRSWIALGLMALGINIAALLAVTPLGFGLVALAYAACFYVAIKHYPSKRYVHATFASLLIFTLIVFVRDAGSSGTLVYAFGGAWLICVLAVIYLVIMGEESEWE